MCAFKFFLLFMLCSLRIRFRYITFGIVVFCYSTLLSVSCAMYVLARGNHSLNCYPLARASSSLCWHIFGCNHVVTFLRFIFNLSCSMCCIAARTTPTTITSTSQQSQVRLISILSCCFVHCLIYRFLPINILIDFTWFLSTLFSVRSSVSSSWIFALMQHVASILESHNKIMVPLNGSFQNFGPSFLYWIF